MSKGKLEFNEISNVGYRVRNEDTALKNTPPPKQVDVYKVVLPSLRKGSIDFYDKLTPEEQKSVTLYAPFCFMAGSTNPMVVLMLDTYINDVLFTLGTKHKRLGLRLLALCGDGGGRDYPKFTHLKTTTANKMIIDIVAKYYGYSKRATEDIMHLVDNDTIMEMALEQGMQDDEIKNLKKELKKRK
jgi:hypothetical protein